MDEVLSVCVRGEEDVARREREDGEVMSVDWFI